MDEIENAAQPGTENLVGCAFRQLKARFPCDFFGDYFRGVVFRASGRLINIFRRPCGLTSRWA